MSNSQWFLLSIVLSVVTFSMIFYSDRILLTANTYFRNYFPEPLTSEEVLSRQKETKSSIKEAFADLGPFWKDGKGIVPASMTMSISVKSTWNPPFFMPVPQQWSSKVETVDTDFTRFTDRQNFFKAALKFNADRCSKQLRKTLMKQFDRYLNRYARWGGGKMENPTYYYATLEDQHLVGLLMRLTGHGYLTISDFSIKPNKRVAGSNIFDDFANAQIKRYSKRRACSNASN